MVRNVLKNKEKSLKLTTLGFTLIELLSVIVILAIIALIATPIILGIIKDAKDQANKRSIDNYAKAIKNSIVKYQLKGKKLGEIVVKTTDGRNFSNVEDFKVEYEGNVVCKTIEIYEDGSIFLAQCKVNDEKVDYSYGEPRVYLPQKNPTTGTAPTQDDNGNIVVSSEFIINVNNKMDRLTFFVLSNSEDGKYVNLIAEQNITKDGEFTREPQGDNEWHSIEGTNIFDNTYGPQTAYNYLSEATSNWTNIPVIKNFDYEDEGHEENSIYGYQSIKTEYDEITKKYMTTIKPLRSSSVTYENMRARLPKYSEVTSTQVGCSSSVGSCPLWMVNYLYNSSHYKIEDGKKNSVGKNYGYWLLSSNPGDIQTVRYVDNVGLISKGNPAANYGIRPVITVLKSDLLKVMQ